MTLPILDCAAPLERSRLDRWVLAIALGSTRLLQLSFDIESARFGRAADSIVLDRPLFVTSIAGSGAKMLTRALHATSHFATPHVRDLPFPLAPNGRATLSKRDEARRLWGSEPTRELDPLAPIEEVFWRVHEGQRYLRRTGLALTIPAPATMHDFQRYVRLVCLDRRSRRYLSDNANSLLRLPALASGFPGALLVHPFRDPLDHAKVALTEHRRAQQWARNDRFRSAITRWLGQHGHGAHHRPFLLDYAPDADADRDTVAYWLQTWISVHKHLLGQIGKVREAQRFVDVDQLLQGQPSTLVRLGAELGLRGPINSSALRPSLSLSGVPDSVPTPMLATARELHAELIRRRV